MSSSTIINQSIVNEICAYAKQKDKTKLNKLIEKNHYCIGVFENEQNAIMKLAKEGDQEAVQFLIDEFDANINDAVKGACMGGKISLAKLLLEQGASIDYAVYGAAASGNKNRQFVNELLSLGAKHRYAIEGAGYGNNVKLLNDILSMVDEQSEVRLFLLNYAVLGAELGKHNELAIELLKKGADPGFAIRGAAIIDNDERCNIIKKGVADPNKLQALEKEQAFGQLFGRHPEKVNMQIDRRTLLRAVTEGGHLPLLLGWNTQIPMDHAEINFLVFYAAGMGQLEIVFNLFKLGANYDRAVEGAAFLGNIPYLNKLINDGADKLMAVRGLINSGILKVEKRVLGLLMFIPDIKFRKVIANAAAIKETEKTLEKSSGKSVDASDAVAHTAPYAAALLRRTGSMKHLIQKYEFTFNEAFLLTSFRNQELQVWFESFRQLINNGLSPDTFIYVASKLTDLSFNETKSLFEKYRLNVLSKNFLINGLEEKKSPLNTLKSIFTSQANMMSILIKELREAKTPEEIDQIIANLAKKNQKLYLSIDEKAKPIIERFAITIKKK